MYRWLVFLHVFSAFVFMLAHGASAAVMYRLRAEREPAALRSLFALRDAAVMPFNLSSAVMIFSGIALAFMGNWWRAGWIWASLGSFVVITLVMSLFGRAYFEKARQLLEEPGRTSRSAAEPSTAPDDLESVLSSGRPHLLLAVGMGGFAFIVYLMMFKPF